nr:MAG: hypothetical protein [Bacteriophage sp.]
MEIINFRSVEKSTQDVSATLKGGSSERWTIQSQKTKYVNGKLSEVIGVGYTASINNSDYILEEDKSINEIQITALVDDTSGTCVLTQNESGNRINLKITTPEEEKEYWEIHFKPIKMDYLFTVTTNIVNEDGTMDGSDLYRNWVVNKNRCAINIHISHIDRIYPDPGNFEVDLLSWSCLDKDGNAFNPNYNLPSNSYFTTKTTGLGSYTLTKVSIPSPSNPPILSSRFSPLKKYPLDLNFIGSDSSNLIRVLR